MRMTNENDECRNEEGRIASDAGTDLNAPSFAIFLRPSPSAGRVPPLAPGGRLHYGSGADPARLERGPPDDRRRPHALLAPARLLLAGLPGRCPADAGDGGGPGHPLRRLPQLDGTRRR